MKRKAKLPFDPKTFLSKVNGGRAISEYRKDKTIFRQGDPSDAVSTFRAARSRRPSSPRRARKPWSHSGNRRLLWGRVPTGQPQRLSTVSALTECVIVRISKTDITRVIHEEPAFAELFISHLLAPTVASKRTSSINCSIRARNVWRGPFCCWRISARKAGRSR